MHSTNSADVATFRTMKAGTILYNGTDLGLLGAPRFTLKKSPEPAAPARATHRRVEISVIVALSAEMPATVWARAQALHNLLATSPQGLLEIRSENGSVLSWQATAGESTLPEAISRRGGVVTLNFSAIETVAADDDMAMTIDPLDGTPMLTIAQPQDWSQSIKQSRADSRSGVRDEVASVITFSARTAYADTLLSTAARAEFLLAEAERLEAIASKEGRIQFAGFDRIVQFEAITAKPSEGWEWIDLAAQARFVTLPGDTEAEVNFKVEVSQDPATGEIRTNISGKVEAPDKATSDAKVNAIIAAWRTSTRRVVKISKADSYLDGEDVSVAEWIGLDFTVEFSEGSPNARYTLKIDTHEGADGSRTTYSGTAYATTLAILLATVATASGGKHPVEIRSDLSVDYATDDEGTVKLLQATFTHEYQTAMTHIRGTVTQAVNQGQFGDWQVSLSGSISAPTYANARSVARSFITNGVVLRTDEETETKAFAADTGTLAVTAQTVTLAFSYGWATAHTNTAIQYEVTENPDYTKMVLETNLSGTCWAVDKTTAIAAVNTTLLSALGLSNPSKYSFTQNYERQTLGAITTERWLQFKFTYSFEGALSGTIAHDIIEAEFSIQRIGQVDHVPMTEIPLAMPVYQLTSGSLSSPGGFGYNIGRLVGSGTVKARVKATAITWGQGKRSLVASVVNGSTYYGAADPPDERIGEVYLPFNGTTVAFHTFTFQYAFRYADGLTGLM